MASNNVQHLHRGSNSEKIDESISSNSKLYKKYLDTKKKLAHLRAITPTSVVGVNSNPPQTTTFPTPPLTQASTITNHSPMLVCQINFDWFEEIGEATRDTDVSSTNNEESIDIHDTDNKEKCIDASLSEDNLRVDNSNHDSDDDDEEEDGVVNYFGQQCDNCRQIESQALITEYRCTHYSLNLNEYNKDDLIGR